MLRTEAIWIGNALASMQPSDLSPLVNVGSASSHFRSVLAPFIDSEIFEPLADRGVRIIHTDLKPEPGVDVPGNIFNDSTISNLKSFRPRAAICSNMLEHVPDVRELVRQLDRLVPVDGYLIVTVPLSYPYHPDPIDRLFRPSPRELADLFAGWQVIKEEVVRNPGFGSTAISNPVRFLKSIACCFAPVPDVGRWLSACHRLLWLFRPYLVTCAVLRRQTAKGAT